MSAAGVGLNWAVAIVPVLLLLAAFEWLDVFHLVGAREMAGVLALGGLAGLAAWPVSGRLLDTLPMGFSTYSRYAAPPLEEALKALAVFALFARNRLGFALDAVVAGFAVGAGFSVVENIFYLTRFPQLDFGVWLVRGLGTATMHGATGAVFAGLAQHLGEREAKAPAAHWRLHPLRYLPGYGAAVAIHTLFNHFPDQPGLAMLTTLLAAPLLILVVFRLGMADADAWIDAEASDHRRTLAALEAGGFPDTAAGRHVAALAARIGGRGSGEEVRELYRTLTALALRAETMLRSHAGRGPAAVDDADVRLIEQRRDLERRLGRTTVAILLPLLPFTRHAWWEIGQLEHRVAHRWSVHASR